MTNRNRVKGKWSGITFWCVLYYWFSPGVFGSSNLRQNNGV